jgi:hypothetical protein
MSNDVWSVFWKGKMSRKEEDRLSTIDRENGDAAEVDEERDTTVALEIELENLKSMNILSLSFS